MALQTYDGIVKSVLQLRPVFPDKTDEEYAAWYEEHFKITERRVLFILEEEKTREMSA